MGEIIFHVFLLGGLGFLLRETFNINLSRFTDVIGPAGFPRGIIIVGMALTCISLFRAVSTKQETSEIKEINRQFLGIICSVVLFIIISDILGFLLATIFLVMSIMLLLRQRKIGKLIIISVVAGLLFTLVFGRLLSVPLPRGIGFIRNLSFFIY